jgi:hypothetical protein
MQVVVVVVFLWLAGRNSGRTDSCLKQLKNIFLSCESSSKSSKTATTTATTKNVLFHLVQSAHLSDGRRTNRR